MHVNVRNTQPHEVMMICGFGAEKAEQQWCRQQSSLLLLNTVTITVNDKTARQQNALDVIIGILNILGS